jgi:hypothetical protein
MSDGPGREEFTAFTNRVYQAIEHGFSDINDRLDVLNGRTGKNEVVAGELGVRIKNVEHELFRTPRRRHTDHAGDGERWGLAFSKREGMLIGFGLVVIEVLLKILEAVGTQLWNVIVHKP